AKDAPSAAARQLDLRLTHRYPLQLLRPHNPSQAPPRPARRPLLSRGRGYGADSPPPPQYAANRCPTGAPMVGGASDPPCLGLVAPRADPPSGPLRAAPPLRPASATTMDAQNMVSPSAASRVYRDIMGYPLTSMRWATAPRACCWPIRCTSHWACPTIAV